MLTMKQMRFGVPLSTNHTRKREFLDSMYLAMP